jgi:hypothetical protein
MGVAMDLWLDVRLAIRGLTRQRSVAIAAITTLAVGIGATTAVFTVADGILRRPLPYRKPNGSSTSFPMGSIRAGLHVRG